MIRSASLSGFMIIADGRHDFAPGLNVIVAPNGAGGHNLLKLLSAVESAGAFTSRWMTKLAFAQSITGRLNENFRPGRVGELARKACRIEVEHGEAEGTLAFGFSEGAEFVAVEAMPAGTAPNRPVFIPMQELASFVPWFPKLFDMWHVGFEGVWRDTCAVLAAEDRKGEPAAPLAALLSRLEERLGGRVAESADGALVVVRDGVPLPMSALDAGERRIVMLARLVRNGMIAPGMVLFWNEPDAGMDDELRALAVEAAAAFAEAGVQVFACTHDRRLASELLERCGGERSQCIALAGL